MRRFLLAAFAFGLSLALVQASAPQKTDKKANDKNAIPKEVDDKKTDEKKKLDPQPEKKPIPKATCSVPCQQCAKVCEECMKHCRENDMYDVARQCEICHHACLMCALAVDGKNVLAWDICQMCELVCIECAAACEKGKSDVMKKCAAECRKCAKACLEARQ